MPRLGPSPGPLIKDLPESHSFLWPPAWHSTAYKPAQGSKEAVRVTLLGYGVPKKGPAFLKYCDSNRADQHIYVTKRLGQTWGIQLNFSAIVRVLCFRHTALIASLPPSRQ